MKAIRPRELRLPIDTVREEIQRNPFVLKVVGRTFGIPDSLNLQLYKVENFDTEYANNYFYWNDTEAPTKFEVRVMMVPFQWNGDE